MQLTAKTKGVCIVLALLALAGVAAWIYQLNGGLAVTGMSNVTSWGLYITSFMFFVGLSAGGLIVASSAHVFNLASFKKIALPAVILSTVCICAAVAFVLIDLGGIQKAWRLFTNGNFTSPLLWDVVVIALYLIINILDIIWMRRGAESKVRKLSYVVLPVAILVHSVTAWIFGLEAAKEGWNSAIMAPIFVASALDSGLALLIVALMGLKKAKIMDVEAGLFGKLGKLLATFIAVDTFLILCEVLTMGYSGGDVPHTILREMTAGATAPWFWFEIICGLLVPFIL
ncbi:MAG: polysulfide reductase NrfD, partial [Eggerthellaceae bacterium]|nr:polysulfide reductase NrfD [Eggerthellaceae bacterium]